jgi:hypothetical protein
MNRGAGLSATVLSTHLTRGPMWWLGCVLTAVLLAGCAPDMSGTVGIPTTPTAAPGQHILCQTARLMPFTLAGDPSTSPPVWGVYRDGRPFPIVWPPGFRARFRPGLEVLAPDGTVIAHGGDVITDAGGGTGPGGEGAVICSIGNKTW